MAIGVRDPGSLPDVFARVEIARQLLQDRRLDKDVRTVVEAVIALALTQHELNKRLWEGKKGTGEPHADTHKGGDDQVVGSQLPAKVVPCSPGDIGDPALGYAPINHEHPFDCGILTELKRIELDFGPVAVVEKVFTVVDASVLPASRLMMIHSGSAATGKQADEAEFDAIDCRCEPLTGSFRVYATSLLGHVFGTFKFDYAVQT